MSGNLIDFFETVETKQKTNELFECTIGTLCNDPIACGKLISLITTSPFFINEQLFWIKFANFCKGTVIQPYDKIMLSNRLFENTDKGRKNALRIIETINRIDTEQILEYVINATRSCLLDLIDVEEYFRITKAITASMPEDLVFLQQHITDLGAQKGNMKVLALANNQLMIMAGLDANEDIENQSYFFTTLGRMVDQYALSLNDEIRQKWHRTHNQKRNFEIEIPTIEVEEIEQLFK